MDGSKAFRVCKLLSSETLRLQCNEIHSSFTEEITCESWKGERLDWEIMIVLKKKKEGEKAGEGLGEHHTHHII